MALPTPPESVDSNAPSDIPISAMSPNIYPSPSPSPSPLRRSGRQSSKTPINYCERAKRRKRNSNQPEKRQKLLDDSPPAAPTADRDQIPITPSKTSRSNALNQPKVNNDTIGATERSTSENPSPQSPAPVPEVTPDNETLPLPWLSHREEIPRFTPAQIRNLLQFNSNRVSPRHARPLLEPSLPAASANMSISTYHLRALVCAAASHYASLPREFGDLKSCLPHLYRTFMPTAAFERWVKESGGGMGVRDTHIVLMKVFEVIFSGRFSSVEAKEMIWELLGFGEVDEGEEEDKYREEGEGGG